MRITRRDFLKYCTIAAGALGLTAIDLLKMEKALALPGGLKIIWLNGQACTGCTVSLANSSYYTTLQSLTLGNPLLTGASETLDIAFIETLSGMTGDQIGSVIETAAAAADGFALVIEGAMPTGDDKYCEIGENWWAGSGTVTIANAVKHYANLTKCAAVIPVGTCACYGGIPAAFPNPTTSKGFLNLIKDAPESGGGAITVAEKRAIRKKTINIPGCPPNPNWIVGTIAFLLANNLSQFPSVDALRRPRTYYGERICNNCDRFENSCIHTTQFPRGKFVGVDGISGPLGGGGMTVVAPNDIGNKDINKPSGYCLKKAGCKGSRTKSDCSLRKWHSPNALQAGVNWCVGAGAPCQGCTQDKFPDGMSPFLYIR